jgi:aspartate kinase
VLPSEAISLYEFAKGPGGVSALAAVGRHPAGLKRVRMSFVVMKFGGTSVANLERIRKVARHVKREVDAGNHVAVVVSAMAGVTNQLVGWVREASPLHDAREYDAVVATGEQVTAGLLAIVLQSMAIPARSWQGWQIPILTDDAHGVARIKDIPGDKIRARLEQGEVAVITGFQGIEPNRNRISTLGRGGSDTSAVALAVAVRADLCDIYTDVDGVFTTDPRMVPRARRLAKISYEEMLEMASLGSKVLQTRSVELAMVHRMRVRVLSSFVPPENLRPVAAESWDEIGTIICSEDEIVEQHVVSGIAYAKDEAKVSLIRVEDKPGVAARIFGPLAEANINVDMIVQNTSSDGKHTDMTFTVQGSDLERALEVLAAAEQEIGYFEVKSSSDVAKVSVIGVGMRSHAGVAAQMFKALAERGINILAITTSEIKISVLIDAVYAELAVRTLHSLYGLGRD